MSVEILLANYSNPQHAADVVSLLNGYALDPMGGGEGLSEYTKQNLVTALIDTKTAFTVLCYVDSKPAGLINCIQGFSTFKCKPIINIHDVTVDSAFRGLGLSMKMIEKVESISKERGACKLTLEVLEGNTIAKNAYTKFGFSGYELDPKMGKAMFWEKAL
jgi:ribosomal protein S18 acetylase RimI-like enzyme